MLTLLSAFGSLLSFRVRSRASLELELVAMRHQLTVLRRQRPGRPRLFSAARLLWVWLYRIWPKVLDAMVLVKPVPAQKTIRSWNRCTEESITASQCCDPTRFEFMPGRAMEVSSGGDLRNAMIGLLA